MGQRGPAKKPTKLEELQGRPGRRPPNQHEAAPDPTKPNCPRFLKPAAKKEWRRMAGRLHDAGLFTYVDRSALAAYCQSYGLWVEAELECKNSGGEVLISDKGNMYHNPWASIAKNARGEMMKYAQQFGMTPSARARIIVDNSGVQKEMNLAETLAVAADAAAAEWARMGAEIAETITEDSD